MSRLIQSGLACKVCPSTDAMSEYENGYHCFSCKKTFYTQARRVVKVEDKKQELICFPDGTEEVDLYCPFLYKYHFTDQMCRKAGFKYHHDCPIWSPRLDKYILTGPRLLMPQFHIMPSGELTFLFWEGKALDKTVQIKSLSCGGAGQYFTTRLEGKSDCVVIVEDILSAWRVHFATGIDCIALRGTNVRIEQIIKTYIKMDVVFDREFYIWMDSDLAGLRASNALKALSIYGTTKLIRTPEDPKCYSDSVIRNFVFNARISDE